MVHTTGSSSATDLEIRDLRREMRHLERRVARLELRRSYFGSEDGHGSPADELPPRVQAAIREQRLILVTATSVMVAVILAIAHLLG